MKERKWYLDGMLIATLLTSIFYSATYPFIHKQIMMVTSDKMIAAVQIINCVSIVFFGTIWNKYSNRLFHLYPIFCILETILSVSCTVFAIVTDNIAAYYILDTLVFSIITRNIVCGGVKLRAIRYDTESSREHFDNNNASASAIATIIGSCIAMVLHLKISIMLCIATFGGAIDNIFYIFIYFNTRRERE